jgi:hypothetical protein
MTATNISLATNDDKKLTLNRKYKTSPDYTIPANMRVGVNQATPTVTSSGVTLAVPILFGTVCDNGSTNMTGSSGGDNTTDNTTTYKQGGNQTDNQSQNLIKNSSNATAIWTNTSLTANADATKYVGLWLYIKDAAALAKFLTAGTALEIRIGADTTTNYYSKVYTASQLTTGWNWLSDGALLSTWTVAGTPGTLNDFAIRITTNNATDTFVVGDVLYDLLRQWVAADTLKALTITLNESTFEASMEMTVQAGYASGFLLDGVETRNTDTSPLCLDIAKHESSSKSDTDIFVYTFVDRLL